MLHYCMLVKFVTHFNTMKVKMRKRTEKKKKRKEKNMKITKMILRKVELSSRVDLDLHSCVVGLLSTFTFF